MPDTAPQPPNSDAPCVCGSGKPFGQCCDPILKQKRLAGNAEELMRSRFTAHVLRDYRHLHRTYLETARRPFVDEPGAAEIKWTRLAVHSHELGVKPGTAYVDFTAYFDDAGAENALHEKAEFALIDGSWFYTRPVRSGPAPLKSKEPKVGRNDPCPCGSGKKYKHCCGR